MIRSILFGLLICLASTLISQDFYSSKVPFLNSKNTPILIADSNGKELIKVPLHYKKNKTAKGKLKMITVKGSEYFLTKHKNLINVHNVEEELVATILCKKKHYIHFIKDNLLYHETKQGWFSKTTEYINAKNSEVISVDFDKRKYILSYEHESKEADMLLLALCLSQDIDKRQAKQRDDELYVFLNSLTSQN